MSEVFAAVLPANELVGFSGACLKLHRRDGRMVVRKTAGSMAQNERLRRQRDQQARFYDAGVATPRVLLSGETSGRMFFEMDYVPAISLAAAICRDGADVARELLAFLERWIDDRRCEVSGEIKPQQLAKKLAAVIEASAANPRLGSALERLPAVAARLTRLAWPALPQSPGHGDLTTENILGDTAGRLVLVDFDAPEISSYCLDVAKLYQDLLGHWCLRRLAQRQVTGVPDPQRAERALSRLREAVDHLAIRMMPELMPDLPALTCLNLMRALPYSSNAADGHFILTRVESLLPMCR